MVDFCLGAELHTLQDIHALLAYAAARGVCVRVGGVGWEGEEGEGEGEGLRWLV